MSRASEDWREKVVQNSALEVVARKRAPEEGEGGGKGRWKWRTQPPCKAMSSLSKPGSPLTTTATPSPSLCNPEVFFTVPPTLAQFLALRRSFATNPLTSTEKTALASLLCTVPVRLPPLLLPLILLPLFFHLSHPFDLIQPLQPLFFGAILNLPVSLLSLPLSLFSFSIPSPFPCRFKGPLLPLHGANSSVYVFLSYFIL